VKEETVTLLRPSASGSDAYGDPVVATVTRIDITGCDVAPRMSAEPTERGREGVVTGWDVYAPAGATVLFTDGIEIRGITCRILGEIADWGTPGVVISAVRAVG